MKQDMLNRARKAHRAWWKSVRYQAFVPEYAFVVGWFLGRQSAQRDARRKAAEAAKERT